MIPTGKERRLLKALADVDDGEGKVNLSRKREDKGDYYEVRGWKIVPGGSAEQEISFTIGARDVEELVEKRFIQLDTQGEASITSAGRKLVNR
jgi:hypothetical protein